MFVSRRRVAYIKEMSEIATVPFHITSETPMQELVSLFPGAQRALFRGYHIGGCSSCGFRPDETLAEVCARNGGLDVTEVAAFLEQAREVDAQMEISPVEANALLQSGAVAFVDIRSREEFEAVRIPSALLFTEELMHELPGWDRSTPIVFVCHHGVRSMDAAAYFAGHGLENVRSLRGGIDAWSCEVDPSLPRYELA